MFLKSFVWYLSHINTFLFSLESQHKIYFSYTLDQKFYFTIPRVKWNALIVFNAQRHFWRHNQCTYKHTYIHIMRKKFHWPSNECTHKLEWMSKPQLSCTCKQLKSTHTHIFVCDHYSWADCSVVCCRSRCYLLSSSL